MKKEVARVRDQLERAHRDAAWHGPSLGELLAGVDEFKARSRPTPGVHTIGELVMHVIAWQEEAVRRLDGKGRDLPAEEDWPLPQPWSEVLARLNTAHEALAARTLRLDDSDLDLDVTGQSGAEW